MEHDAIYLLIIQHFQMKLQLSFPPVLMDNKSQNFVALVDFTSWFVLKASLVLIALPLYLQDIYYVQVSSLYWTRCVILVNTFKVKYHYFSSTINLLLLFFFYASLYLDWYSFLNLECHFHGLYLHIKINIRYDDLCICNFSQMFVNMDEICLFQQAKMSIQQFIITIK